MNIVFRCDPALIDLLPRPLPCGQALPQWLRDMPARVHSPVHQRGIRTLKQCPPFVDAMSHGFFILLPCDVQVDNGRFAWDWPLPALKVANHPRSPLSFHVPEQLHASPLARREQVAIKFNAFWTIELEPGWSLWVAHPANRDDLPFRLVSGLVDADRFIDAGINFPAIWTDPGFRGVLPRGTPVAQCHAVPREPPQLSCEAMTDEQARRYGRLANEVMGTPGVYRKQYRSKRRDV